MAHPRNLLDFLELVVNFVMHQLLTSLQVYRHTSQQLVMHQLAASSFMKFQLTGSKFLPLRIDLQLLAQTKRLGLVSFVAEAAEANTAM